MSDRSSFRPAGCAHCSRREFLGRLGTVAAGAVALRQAGCGAGGPTGTGSATLLGSTMTIDLTQSANASLGNSGGALLFDAPADTIIVIRTGASTVDALSAVCTHAGCLVGFNSTLGRLQCPCHGSIYSETGAVLGGPSPRPLRQYAASLEGNTVTVSLD